jgi:hypothetical protein
MTTRKIIIIVVSIVLALALIVVIFAGGIIGIVFYSIGNSEAAETARTFLKKNERLKADIGEIKEFGSIVTGSVNIDGGSGKSTINVKAVGERKSVNCSVELIYRNGQPWRVTAASYENDKGETIELLNPYQGRMLLPSDIVRQAFLPVLFPPDDRPKDKVSIREGTRSNAYPTHAKLKVAA